MKAAQTVFIVLFATLLSSSIAIDLKGKLSAVFVDGGDLVTRTFELPADVRVDRLYPGGAASSVQSATATGKDRHSFESSSGVYYEAIMKNSSVTFLRRDEDAMKMVFVMHVEYPEGCTASYLLPGFRDTSLFVALEGCVPLRINLYDTSFPSEQIFLGLQGKKVVVLAGHDAYGTEDVFYAYVNDASNVEFLSFSYVETWALPATDIGSCSVVTDLHSLSTSTNTSTLDVVVDCLDSAVNKLRYLVYVVYNEGIDRVLAVSKVDGEPQASEDGAFLAIQQQKGDVYSLFVYEVANILNTPAPANYMAPFTMKFLQAGGLTILVILSEGEDIQKIDVHSFTSSNGLQGRKSIPGATVTSCVECTTVEIIAGNILMMSVWSPDTLFYDLLYVELESDSLTPSRVPQVSSEPLLFSFVGFPVEPSTTETEPSSTDTTTNSPGSGEQSEPPTTSGEESPTSHPQPRITHPAAIVGWVVLCALCIMCILVCLVDTVLLVYVYHRCTTTSTKYSQEEEGGGMTPKTATSFDCGQIVTPTFQIIPKPMQETVPADDVGYMTSSANSSLPSTRAPTPQDTPLPRHRE